SMGRGTKYLSLGPGFLSHLRKLAAARRIPRTRAVALPPLRLLRRRMGSAPVALRLLFDDQSPATWLLLRRVGRRQAPRDDLLRVSRLCENGLHAGWASPAALARRRCRDSAPRSRRHRPGLHGGLISTGTIRVNFAARQMESRSHACRE